MLTFEQIQTIDWFFEEKGLEFYDLRMELIDHVSEAIENTMKEHHGMSFDQAFEQETRKFTRNDLVLQIAEADEPFNPLKEWRYFTFKRTGSLLLIFLLLISPATLLNSQWWIYIELIYLLTGTGWYLRSLLRFKRKYKNPRKKLKLYFSERLFDYLFPFLYLVVMFLRTLKWETIPVEKEWIFFIFVFLELQMIAALLAKMDAKKKQYHAAKKTYPFLFEN